MQLVKKSDEPEDGVMSRLGALVSLVEKGADDVARWTGLTLLTYHLNPFNLIPEVKPETEVFSKVRRFGDYLERAHRGGLFRRRDR